MNEQQFKKWMSAIDDEFLEEAQQSAKRRPVKIRWIAGAVAACICIAMVGSIWQPWKHIASPEDNNLISYNQVQTATKEELTGLGYRLPQLVGAKNIVYATVSQGEGAVPMAQMTFSKDGQEYTCRALQTDIPQDISGFGEDWSETMNWVMDTVSMQFCASDSNAWVGWYSDETQTQWCLSAPDADRITLMSTAQEIVEALGYNVNVAPAGATNITYQAFMQDDMIVAETAFDLDGVRYVFHMASTMEIAENFPDISGDETSYTVNQSGEVDWCPARLSYDEGGCGKIMWLDVAPGLLYSLTMDNDASKEALIEMAIQIFEPAQESDR